MSREMPHDTDAEKSVLGSMLISNSVAVEMLSTLIPEDFYVERHQVIYENMQLLHNKSMGIDITTLTAQLRDVNALDKAGGVEYLLSISESVPTTVHSKYYSQIILDKALLRRLIEQATKMIEDASSGDIEDIGDFISESEKGILSVTRDRNYGEFQTAESVVDKFTNRLYLLKKNNGLVSGLKTNFTDLDNMTSGLQKGDLIILAARPAVGKTAFALNIAHHVASDENNEPVAMFSLEMPAEQLISRIISSMGGIEGSLLKNGQILNNDPQNYLATADRVRRCNLYIDDSPGIKINEIVSKCRRLKQEHGLSLVVIDYLQLITGTGKDSRQQEISDISRQLKVMARELEVPVIALSQLSRSVEKREDKRPMLSDLRESGAIEQDADIVAFLYRDDYYSKNDQQQQEKAGIVELNLAKHRNGETGRILFAFEKNFSRFTSLDQNQAQQATKDVRV